MSQPFHLVLKTTHRSTRCLGSILTVSDVPQRRVAMKIKGSLLVLVFALTPVMWAQEKPAQAPPGPVSGDQMRTEHRQQMMAMHRQEMEAMRADIGRMKSSLAQMK